MKFLSRTILAAAMTASLSLPLARAEALAKDVRAVTADMNAIAGPMSTAWQDCVGSGHAGLLLRKANQDQMRLVHDETGFKYIRFHGIFTEYTDA